MEFNEEQDRGETRTSQTSSTPHLRTKEDLYTKARKVLRNFEERREAERYQYQKKIEHLTQESQNLEILRENLAIQRKIYLKEFFRALNRYKQVRQDIINSFEYKTALEPYLARLEKLLISKKPINPGQIAAAKRNKDMIKERFLGRINRKMEDLEKNANVTLAHFETQNREIHTQASAIEDKYSKIYENYRRRINLLKYEKMLSLSHLRMEKALIEDESNS